MSLSSQPNWDIRKLRKHFPVFENCPQTIFFDGPGGTQVPACVTEAMSDYLQGGNSNLGGSFPISNRTVELLKETRELMGVFLNARFPEEISFGSNMTSLTFSFSRALARTWNAGDEIIVTKVDHAANVSPWLAAAEEIGAKVHFLDVSKDCGVDVDKLAIYLNKRTRLVALTAASNFSGTVTDIKKAIGLAHAAGAQVFVDAVHYAPHFLIDVLQWDCDYLVCSAYKFFGPHIGVLYGRKELTSSLEAFRVRPVPDRLPAKWETGTQSFEAVAGLKACLHYLSDLSGGDFSRQALQRSYELLMRYESQLMAYFLQRLEEFEDCQLYGVPIVNRCRTATFALRFGERKPVDLARALGRENICTWNGHFYASWLVEALGLSSKGGVLRVGLMHYNTREEIDHFFEVLAKALEL